MKRIKEFLSSVPMTIVGGVFLVLSFVLPMLNVKSPVDPAWVTVIISGLPLLYLAVWRIIYNPGISKISSALLITVAMIAAIVIGDLFAAGEVAFIMAIGEILEDMMDGKIDEDSVSKDEVIDLLTPLSMNSFVELSELFGVEDSDIVQAWSLIITVIWVVAIFLIVLTALGVLFQKSWLMVLSLIFGIVFILITAGTTYLLFTAIAYIATAVLFSKLKKSYKAYKRACKKA